MPNIMITKRCNLSCPYCFANDFVNQKSDCDMSMETMEKILNFILLDGSTQRVRLIGGEPTCHQQFDKILERLTAEERLNQVTLYTNGILLSAYLKQLSHEKYRILINCNEPSYMGENWSKSKTAA